MLASALTCAKTGWLGEKFQSALAEQKLAKCEPKDNLKLCVVRFTGWLGLSCDYGVHVAEVRSEHDERAERYGRSRIGAIGHRLYGPT